MFERTILIIDDNDKIESIFIPAYIAEIERMKQEFIKWEKYSFNFIHKNSMKSALEYLKDPQNIADVLVVDFDFKGEQTFTNGTAFVKYIRENLNRYCQIIFYTMHGIDFIEKKELVDLINSDVYMMIDKSAVELNLGKVIFNAATLRNPIVESFEKFYAKYYNILKENSYILFGETMTFDEVIQHIRMDDTQGRMLIEKLLQKSILFNTEITE